VTRSGVGGYGPRAETASDLTIDVMTAESPRAEFRRRVRERVLDAARESAVSRGWDQVRVGDVAVAAGVSRPTLYREFGSKDGVGEALIVREADHFLAGVGGVLDQHDDPALGIREAAAFTLREAAANPLLHAVLTGARPGDVNLLPYLTTRSQAILDGARGLLTGWIAVREPGHVAALVDETVDAVVRLVISHLVVPSVESEVVADRMGRLVRNTLGDRSGK